MKRKILLFILITITLLATGCSEMPSQKLLSEWEKEKIVIRNKDDLAEISKRNGEILPVLIYGTPEKSKELVSDRFKSGHEYVFVGEIGELYVSSGGTAIKIPGTNVYSASSGNRWKMIMTADLSEPKFILNGIEFKVSEFIQNNLIGSHLELRRLNNEEISNNLKDTLQRNVNDDYYYENASNRYSYYVIDPLPMKILAYIKDGVILNSQEHPRLLIREDGTTFQLVP